MSSESPELELSSDRAPDERDPAIAVPEDDAPDERRLEPASVLADLVRRVDAADLLETRGFDRDAASLLALAIHELLDRSDALAPPESTILGLRDALTSLEADPSPRDVGALRAALERARDALRLVEAARRPTRVRRVDRVLWIAGVLAVALVLAAVAVDEAHRFQRTLRLHATATHTWQDDRRFDAAHVVDGDPSTEWLGNDGPSATLDVRLSRSVDLREIRILNGRNAPYFDRAAGHFVLNFYAGTQLLRRATGDFDQLERHPAWKRIFASVPGVDRIRLVITSAHGIGPSIAEIAIVER